MCRKPDERRDIAEPRKPSEEKKEKLRKIEERVLKTGYNAQNNSYENPTPMFRTNAYLDKHSKESKEANLVPENQPESLERQPADKKELRASLTVVEKGSKPPTLTALNDNNFNTNKDVERIQSLKLKNEKF